MKLQMFRPSDLRCWSTEGLWCCQGGGDDDDDDTNYNGGGCGDDDYADDVDYGDDEHIIDDDNVDNGDISLVIFQVVSINCSVSANPSTDLVFR